MQNQFVTKYISETLSNFTQIIFLLYSFHLKLVTYFKKNYEMANINLKYISHYQQLNKV
ncbi:unnamed protein product [Paramecium octaurelia]|uniref:Transmembrane protein n=1 Tax=Paramecium octaurelia TaxID=43137 RepID=A0A8S1T5X6_PAROT|nr:unnamed protein product [Paramecium octaurelia]